MTEAEFEILSGKSPILLGQKVSARLRTGWELHGNTWSTGTDIYPEFHQAVMKVETKEVT